MTTTTKLAGHLSNGDAVNVNGERCTVSQVELYYAGLIARVEFLVNGPGWTSAVDCEAGDSVWLWTGLSLDDEEDADAETFLALDSRV